LVFIALLFHQLFNWESLQVKIFGLTGRRPEFVISDRVRYVNIDQLFLISYIKLLIKVCHKRGALATGGMAALVLDGDDSK
jgi:malate synthase